MKLRLFASVLLLSLLVAGLGTAGAQARPTIVSFESSLDSITVAEAENGSMTTTLSWHTAGMTEEFRLSLNTYQIDRWVAVFPQTSVPLESSGSREVTVSHPLNFGPPMFLLSILEASSNAIIEQRVVTIPYVVPDQSDADNELAIQAFSAELDTVEASFLAAGSGRIAVSWQIVNRLPGTNLVFEQVLDDDEAQSIEVPRTYLWVPSSGEGPVVPRLPADDADEIVLRLRVENLISGDTLAEETITIAVTGDVVVTPTPTPVPATMTPAPGTGRITSFTVAPTLVNPGSPVTLAWEVTGTGGISIEQSVPGLVGTSTVVSAQSRQGTTTITLPDFAVYSVVYTLFTADRASNQSVTVAVNCTRTFFFGAGDGCPTGSANEVNAAFQQFEGGYMLWRGDTNEIYVHYDDGTFQNGSAQYFLESSYGNLPDPELDEAPPLDRVAPVSGFGKVWANGPGVRDKLGWALDVEQAYTMRIQQVARGRVPAPEFLFYLTLPSGEVVGTGFGQWRMISS